MPEPVFDSARFRQVLGHFPTGVTVVTAMAEDGRPAGLAVGSFCSVSLEPPLVLFCPANNSSTFPAIRAAGVFCVNVLAENQEDVCRVFASKESDKFASIGWKASSRTGSPMINDALAYIDCEVDHVDEAGDHSIVVGRVVDLEIGDEPAGPLLFYRGGYGRFAV